MFLFLFSNKPWRCVRKVTSAGFTHLYGTYSSGFSTGSYVR